MFGRRLTLNQSAVVAGAKCPYCSATLGKVPRRKTRCKTCGNVMLVKSLVDTRERVIVTEAQAEEIEGAWTAHYQRRATEQMVRRYGLSSEAFQANRLAQPGGSDRDLLWGLLNQSVQELMRIGDLGALKSRYYEMALFCAEEGRPFVHLLESSHDMELRSLLSIGGRRVSILSAGRGSACPACQRLDGKTYSIEEALKSKPLPCRDCTTVVVGTAPGFCRCCVCAGPL